MVYGNKMTNGYIYFIKSLLKYLEMENIFDLDTLNFKAQLKVQGLGLLFFKVVNFIF